MADARKNFAISTVATAPSPATSGTSLVVAAGDGTARFPAAPFNAVVWPTGANPTAGNAEIVRVTNKATDTFTITRTQEGSSARSIIVGDQIMQAVTDKTLADIEALFPTGMVLGTTDSQTATNKVLSDVYMGEVFDSRVLAHSATLLASTAHVANDSIEIGATVTLTIPSTSTLEILPLVSISAAQTLYNKTIITPIIVNFSSVSGMGAAWPSWTITWSNFTPGNATVDAGYIQMGRLVHFRLRVVLGSTSSVSGAISFNPPVTPVSAETQASGYVNMIGTAGIVRQGVAYYAGSLFLQSATTITMAVHGASGTFLTSNDINSTTPGTWASTDIFFCRGFYEAATS